MARFSDEFLNELRMRCDIEQVISPYVNLKRRGKNLVGLCPFHNEKTPSFTVYPENQSFYCFGCGAGGEAIGFIRRAENLDFTEAVRYLCDKSGMVMPSEGFDNSLSVKRKRMYEINKEAARFFNSCLFSEKGKDGLEYFKSRGYKKSTITRFGLGYAPNEWRALLTHMRGLGYSYEELYEANLANRSDKDGKISYYDSFRNRVMVPIIDVRGNVVAFGGRVLDDSKPKYINTSDTLVYKKSLGVFGLNFAKNSPEKTLILVEGYMDAISLHEAGFTNAIACLGTALTSEMAHLLSRYAEEIILSYDADEAGQKATERAIGILGSIGMKMRVIHLSGGKDPDEILKKYGPERYRSLIEGAANDIEFELLKARDGFDLNTSDGKMKYLEKAAQILSKTKSEITRDIYSSRLSEELGVKKEAISARINQISRMNTRKESREFFIKAPQQNISESTKTALANSTNIRVVRAEEQLIATLMKNPDYYRHIEKIVSAEDFSVALYKRIFSLITEKIKEQRSLELTFFAEELTPTEMNTFVKICRDSTKSGNSLRFCEDCIAVMKEEKKKALEKPDLSTISDEDFRNLFKKK
ncbi:MAG: DNA primase [Clostridia bacterium]|nr:DNA primase [Clostridia bacterium]